MTRQLQFETGTAFGRWLRTQKSIDSRQFGLSIQNLDYIIHRYNFPSCQAIMMIEEKTFNGKQSFAQRDTHSILHQALSHANGKTVITARGKVMNLRYCGYHLLVFEKTTPDDGQMWWNGQPLSIEYLLRLLRFEVDPSKAIPQQAA